MFFINPHFLITIIKLVILFLLLETISKITRSGWGSNLVKKKRKKHPPLGELEKKNSPKQFFPFFRLFFCLYSFFFFPTPIGGRLLGGTGRAQMKIVAGGR